MANPGSTSAFYPARPTVLLDGQENTNLSGGLLRLLIEETTEGLFRCEATFGNWGTGDGNVGFLYFDRSVLDFGKPFAIRIGEGDTAAQVFEGRVMGMEALYPKTQPPELTVLAEDRFQDLRMTRRTRTFEDVGDSDVIEQIASQHGLSPDVDIDGPTYRVLAQVNQSDLAFLRGRARAIDARMWIEGSTLYARQRGQDNGDSVTLTYGQGLLEFSVLADLANQRTGLTVSGWDVSAKENIEYEATESAIRGELNGHQGGSSVLQSAIGERVDRIVHVVPLTIEEAQCVAEARYRMAAREFLSGRGVAEGDGNIRVGTTVDLRGLGGLFDGEYCVTEAQHTFDPGDGYRTTFAVRRPGLGSG